MRQDNGYKKMTIAVSRNSQKGKYWLRKIISHKTGEGK